ncbi:hypothetical protein KP509_06G063800 [Ceratopteris richardii]|uniref:K Homology domain-containing protein n=1 Tax=Ceratopteris richardii TaxID=49495 RepID=A0A8T2UPV5_CERRI|nr:hypothetical protein KP509_06G063800 [Ceratopteris richardii]
MESRTAALRSGAVFEVEFPTSGQKRDHDVEQMNLDDNKWPGWPGFNVFRLIIPIHKVGGVIGRKGELIKKMCEETRSRIKILDPFPGASERVVMVSARDELEAAISPAMDGLLRVHKHIMDGSDGEIGSKVQSSNSSVTSKLLVPGIQGGSLIGKQGVVVKSIQDASGANVRLLSADEVPSFGLPDDRVVQVEGEVARVSRAMELILSHLRKFLVDHSILPLFEVHRAAQPSSQQAVLQPFQGPHVPFSFSNTAGSGSGKAQGYLDPAFHADSFQVADVYNSQSHHDLSLYGRSLGVGGQNMHATRAPVPIITQVTQKMQIPLSYADTIIGTAGANISHMRRTSGATITVQESRGVHGEMTVEIHGTASQVQVAEQMIQKCMAGITIASTNRADSSYGSYSSQNTYPSVTGTMPSFASAIPYGSSAYDNSYTY